MKKAILIGLVLSIVSCNTNNTINTSNKNNLIKSIISNSNTTVSGKIEFPKSFSIKVSLAQVGSDATVSIVTPPDSANPNKTIATGLTDNSGVFTINPDSGFTPSTNDIYILEAAKRVGEAGNDLITIRTLLKWNGSSWESITKNFNNNTWPIFINTKTTALTIISTKNSYITSNDTIGTIDVSSGSSVPSEINGTETINYEPSSITTPPVLRVVVDNNVNDSSGNNLDGTLMGGANYTTDRNNNSNGALNLDGNDDYIKFGTNSLFNNPQMTLSIWVKSETENWNNHGWFVSYRRNIQGNGFVFHPNSGQKTVSAFTGDNGIWKASTKLIADTTQWHHYVMTNNGTNLKLFVDGNLESNSVVGPVTYNGTTLSEGLTVGYDQVLSGGYGSGVVDDIRLFDYAISDSQVNDLFNHSFNNANSNITTEKILDVAEQVSTLISGGADPNTFFEYDSVNNVYNKKFDQDYINNAFLNGNCVSCDMSSKDLSNSDLSNANYKKTNFSDTNSNLANTNLSSANLTNTMLSGSNVTGTNFSNVNLTVAKGVNGTINGFSNFNFSQANLSNANLSSSDLTNSDIVEATLSNTNLSNSYLNTANLSFSNLSSSDLTNSNLTGANLNGTIFNNTDLNNANLNGTYLEDASFTDANLTFSLVNNSNSVNLNLSNTNLSYSELKSSNLTNSNLNNSNFTGSDLSNTNLNQSIINNSDFTDAVLTNADLSDSDLTNTNFTNAYLVNADLTNANLSGNILTNANLSNVNLNFTNLTNSNLSNTTLNSVDLRVARGTNGTINDFSNFNFQDTSLSSANFENSNLTSANFSHAHLFSANLINANLTNANLYAADLDNSFLNNANLSNANLDDVTLNNTNLTNANLSGATWTDGTTCTIDNSFDGVCHN